MTRVFIGGSRRISRLSPDVRGRLDRILEKRLHVVIGDANGADKAVQRYLNGRGYDRVEVFSADERPRNNLGGWPVRVIRPRRAKRDFEYFAAKDRAMAEGATVGLMLWDGESRGTLMNVLRLSQAGKPVVVYVALQRRFIEVRTNAEFESLLAGLDDVSVSRLRALAANEASLGSQESLPV